MDNKDFMPDLNRSLEFSTKELEEQDLSMIIGAILEGAAPPEEKADPLAIDPAAGGADMGMGAGTDPLAGGGMGMGGGGFDTFGGMGGGFGAEPEVQLTRSELGRVYQMKRIHSKLLALDSFLTDINDERMVKLKKFISNSIDLFNLVVDNYDKFKAVEKIDDIIVDFYTMLKRAYMVVAQFFKEKLEEEKKETPEAGVATAELDKPEKIETDSESKMDEIVDERREKEEAEAETVVKTKDDDKDIEKERPKEPPEEDLEEKQLEEEEPIEDDEEKKKKEFKNV